MSVEYPPNVCRMSVKYLTTMSDTSYVNQISAECLWNIRQMSVEYLPNVCRISDNYVRQFLFQPNTRPISVEYPTNVCRISDKYIRHFLHQLCHDPASYSSQCKFDYTSVSFADLL